jgi:hypothetical protein
VPRILRLLSTVVVLVALGAAATGCTGGAQGADGTTDEATATRTAPDRLGACRVLAPADVERASNTSPVVDCARRHTSETFAVGSFPAAVAAKGRESTALGSYVYDHCQPGLRRFLGATPSLALRSTLTWAWFRAPEAAWTAGTHTWRCDVVAGGDGAPAFLPLPATAKGLLLGKPRDRWLVCVDAATVSGSAKIPCSRPHTWRAVTSIVLGGAKDPYPGDRLSEVRTRDFCSDSVGAWMNYPVDFDYGYTFFHAAEWKAGTRRAICWARTDQ